MKKANFLLPVFLILIISGVFSSFGLNAQDTPKLIYDQSGYVKYIRFDGKNKTSNWDSPSTPDGFFKNILGALEQDKFILINKRERNDGSYYEHYRQYFKGIEVEDGLFILHFNNGILTKAIGHYVNTAGIDPSPALTPEEASKSYGDYLQIPTTQPLKFLHGIVIAEIEENLNADTNYYAKLCYRIDLLDNLAHNGETGYIDAHTGKVLKTQKNWYDYSATGTFSTLYSGTQSAGTQYYDYVYHLIDSSRNAIINTWDMNDTYYDTYATNAVEFTDNDNNWTATEHLANHDQMALDIHWAMQEIYDYFDIEHNLQSFDDSSHMIDAFVHCNFPDGYGGITGDNAGFAWFSNGYEAFFFGDGQYVFNPVASLDAVSHEFAHGITHNFTGLSQDGGVQDAMNEGLSDIWGAVIENEVAPGKDHWKIGEEIIDVSGDNCLRNIQYPESSQANMQMADTYGDATYTSGNYYAKSGVMSHWFYLIAHGGSGTNDNDDDYSVYELGIDEAAKIVFEGQTGHFGSVDTYSEARIAMMDASDNIYGTNSIQSLQVKNAWYAVGVGTNPGQVTITGPSNDLVCSSGANFTVNNVPSGHTVSWTCSSNLSLVSASGNNATFAAGSSASSAGWVQANINNTSYGGSVPVRYEVWCGTPQITYKKVDGYNYYTGFQICPGDHYLSVTPVGGDAGTATWTVPYGIMYFVGTNTLDFTFPSNANSVAITARSANTCGTGPNSSFYLTKKTWGCYDSYAMTLSPNPASDNVTITMLENQPLINYAESGNTTVDVDVKTYEPTSYTINIYNNQSIKLASVTRSGKSFNVPLINLLDGTYTIEVSDGRNSYRQQLVVERH